MDARIGRVSQFPVFTVNYLTDVDQRFRGWVVTQLSDVAFRPVPMTGNGLV